MRNVREVDTRNQLATLRLAILLGAGASVVHGIANGELLVVLAKGIRICLECIGIA